VLVEGTGRGEVTPATGVAAPGAAGEEFAGFDEPGLEVFGLTVGCVGVDANGPAWAATFEAVRFPASLEASCTLPGDVAGFIGCAEPDPGLTAAGSREAGGAVPCAVFGWGGLFEATTAGFCAVPVVCGKTAGAVVGGPEGGGLLGREAAGLAATAFGD